MTKKLWQQNGQLDGFVEAFETKADLVVDQKLIAADVVASLAHAMTLAKAGLLNQEELKIIKSGLWEILDLEKKGVFVLKFGDEDIHTKIEAFLTKEYGQVGKKIHAGRSRNDQVLAATRLFTKEQMLVIWKELLDLVNSFLGFAKEYEFIPMPGYTHTQKAMPSSVGMWAGAFSEALLDNLEPFKAAFKLNNQSPLGSAAGYGVPLALDRGCTAGLLGFAKVQKNSLYCQNSRGKIESVVLAALATILLDLNKFASDVLFFTSPGTNYFRVAPELCTGSSIMPQKQNVDLAELLRSRVHLVLGHYTQVVSLTGNLISGYNRDLQDIKPLLINSLEITSDCLKAAHLLIENLAPDEERLKKAMTPEIFTAHAALRLVKEGVPFREAYQQVAQSMDEATISDVGKILKQSTHVGGTGNLGLDQTKQQIKGEQVLFQQEQTQFTETVNELLANKEGGKEHG